LIAEYRNHRQQSLGTTIVGLLSLVVGCATASAARPSLWSRTCFFTYGPYQGRQSFFPNSNPAPVGATCSDGMTSTGYAVPDGFPPDTLWSKTCSFTNGPLTGQRLFFPTGYPARLGAACSDGMASSGTAVPDVVGMPSGVETFVAQPAATPTQPACKPPGTRYNQVRQISSHNSYDRCGMNPQQCTPKGSIEDQLNAGIRSFEFDIHRTNTAFFNRDVAHSEWAVYHVTNLGSGGDHCQSLSSCLGKLKHWHDAHLDHEVITIWLQLTDGWKIGGHWPIDLDANRLERDLGGALFRPADLRHACPTANSLQETVRGSCSWPTVDQLRSKFIVVLMGDNGHEQFYLSHVNRYRPGGQNPRMSSFVAPDINGQCHLELGQWPDAVFFNVHNSDALSMADCVFGAGLVSRVWRIDGASEWNAARAHRAHHLATDEVMNSVQSPRALDTCGRPFEVITP
jgi:hypothetical protein